MTFVAVKFVVWQQLLLVSSVLMSKKILVVVYSLDSCSGSIRDSKCNSPSSPASPSSPSESMTGGLVLNDTTGKTTFTNILRSLSNPASKGCYALAVL